LAKQENCHVAVSLSASTNTASRPIAFCLYLPEGWATDAERRKEGSIPEQVRFRTKPQTALQQIRQAAQDEVPQAPVLADAGYGIDSQFCAGITELGLPYVVGVQSTTSVWVPGTAPLPAKPWSGQGRPPRLLRRNKNHQPLSARALALSLPATTWKTITWRAGTKQPLRSRFAVAFVNSIWVWLFWNDA
jgi:SRSO17 transposase